MKKKVDFIEFISSNKIIFVFFIILVFAVYRKLFQSYFEADEWFAFTHFLPLTNQKYGFLDALVKSVMDTEALSRGQHVTPISYEIFFLNVRFFGINFIPYALLSLLLHTVNSFLVFLFIKTLLHQKQDLTKNVFAILGGIFFALSAIPMHAVTWAAGYGQNVLSVTFFLLCVISFKTAFIKSEKKLIYLSVIFLFLALFTKETAVFLFLLLPFMAIIEKRDLPAGRQVSSLKFLGKLFVFCVIIYAAFRFVIPNFNTLPGKIIDKFVEGYIPKSYTQPTKTVDTGTIVSTDLSIHKNIVAELAFRTVTFPIQMTSELFFPRETILSFMHVITPIVYPLPDNVSGAEEIVRSQNYQFFVNGPGNNFLIYLFSIGIFSLLMYLAKKFLRSRKTIEVQTLSTGMAIITFGALPLVLIVLSFPRWGYDTYFDSRHYYMPSVGAAILFPFLLFAIGGFLSKIISSVLKFSIPPFLIISFLFLLWLVNNMNVFQKNMHIIVELTGFPRKQIITQIKQYLPTLSSKTVFYVETDGLGAYGPQLPFQTSVPQALTVVYYDKNPLPDSFFNKALFEGKSQGYAYLDKRGFGYYTSKKELSEALLANSFSVNDLYGFYYDSQKIKLKNITQAIRKEMNDYLANAKNNVDWKNFQDPLIKLSFKYPPEAQVTETLGNGESEILKSFRLDHTGFNASLRILNSSTSLTMDEIKKILRQKDNIISKKVHFDKFHFNDALLVKNDQDQYLIKFEDKLVYLNIERSVDSSLIERILGSMEYGK